MTDKFEKPTPVDDVMMAFPANVAHLMPDMKDIPAEFKERDNPGVKFQQEWFFKGLKEIPDAKDGIDLNMAMRHLHCIQGSFQPKHEHKEAAVAYLASKWLKLGD